MKELASTDRNANRVIALKPMGTVPDRWLLPTFNAVSVVRDVRASRPGPVNALRHKFSDLSAVHAVIPVGIGDYRS